MSGGGGTQAGGPAPIPLLQAETTGFGSVPWPNVTSAASNAYSGIGGLNTNPGAQYGAYALPGGYDNQLGLAGLNAVSQGSNLYPYATAPLQAGGQVISKMFDPQNGYYKELFNQNQQQANAENAMAGVATTPYGAYLTNQADQNFNNQWQSFLNQQQNTAANTASTLYGTGGNILGAAGNQYTTGANLFGSGLNLGQSIDTQNYNALNTQIQDYINYLLGSGSNAAQYFGSANNTYGGAVGAAGLSAQAAAQNNNSIGSALGGLGSLAGSLGKLGLSFL